MIYTIYTAGYGNQVPDQLFERLEMVADSLLVIDVRAIRKSWARAYTGPTVEDVVKKRGHDYIWLRQLGNANRNSPVRQIRLIDEVIGMWALEQQIRRSGLPIVLLCAERLSKECHRSVVAEKLRVRLEADGDHLEVRPL